MADAAEDPSPVSTADFLAWEDDQPERHELLDGVVRLMTGGTAAHNLVVQNVAGQLRARWRPGGCGTFTENMRVVTPSGNVTYPDVVVDCGAWSNGDTQLQAAAVIVEVISESSKSTDRGEKWFGYQGIATLRHYLLVDPAAASVEVYSRRDDGSWTYRHVVGLEALFTLQVGDPIAVADVYTDVLA